MEVTKLEQEISDLRNQLREKENQLSELKTANKIADKLTNEEIARYSRQIILSDIGVKGQLKLKNSSILIVGAGGLGCPSALYLVGAGIGKVGIVDYDEVEITNLHRQLLHTEGSIQQSKVLSAKEALTKLNCNIEIIPYKIQLDSLNALEIIKDYDVVLDCTDNVATRYLLNDACVMSKKPLVSGSALQLEGQLTVYNHNKGPCYRCIFPTPPLPESVTNCGDGGVIGAITGVIGALQALEGIKIILNHEGVLSQKLLLFDGSECRFRNIKLRERRLNCDVCGDEPTITKLIDYEIFCHMKATDKDSHLSLLTPDERITVQEYNQILLSGQKHLLIDVRSSNEFEICNLESSINLPIKDVCDDKKNSEILEKIKIEKMPVFCLCRRGNDSQKAVKFLQQALKGFAEPKDIIGGLHAWAKEINNDFPVY